MGMKNMKAQFWSFDVIFAIIIFSISLTIIGFAWYNLNSQLSLSYGSASVIEQLQAHSLAQNLLSPGSPSGWQSFVNTTNSLTWAGVSVGLANSTLSTALSPSKIYTLMSMANTNYQATKQELGVGYDYYIVITSKGYNITIGRNPSKNGALATFVDRRNAFVGTSPAVVEVIVWTNSTLGIG